MGGQKENGLKWDAIGILLSKNLRLFFSLSLTCNVDLLFTQITVQIGSYCSCYFEFVTSFLIFFVVALTCFICEMEVATTC